MEIQLQQMPDCQASCCDSGNNYQFVVPFIISLDNLFHKLIFLLLCLIDNCCDLFWLLFVQSENEIRDGAGGGFNERQDRVSAASVEITEDGFDDYGRRVKGRSSDKLAKEAAALARLQQNYGFLLDPKALIATGSASDKKNSQFENADESRGTKSNKDPFAISSSRHRSGSSRSRSPKKSSSTRDHETSSSNKYGPSGGDKDKDRDRHKDSRSGARDEGRGRDKRDDKSHRDRSRSRERSSRDNRDKNRR